MKKLFLSAAVLAAFIASAQAEDIRVGDLVIQQVWARETPKMARAGASYMMITNEGDQADKLIAAASDVSNKTEMHTHIMENDVMKMSHVEAIDIPAGAMIKFEPGGYHIMYMGLKEPLSMGEQFEVRLTFEKAGEAVISVPVQDIGSKAADTHEHGGHDHGDHGDHGDHADHKDDGHGDHKHDDGHNHN